MPPPTKGLLGVLVTAEAMDEYRHKSTQYDKLIRFMGGLDRDPKEFRDLLEAGRQPGDILYTLFKKFEADADNQSGV